MHGIILINNGIWSQHQTWLFFEEQLIIHTNHTKAVLADDLILTKIYCIFSAHSFKVCNCPKKSFTRINLLLSSNICICLLFDEWYTNWFDNILGSKLMNRCIPQFVNNWNPPDFCKGFWLDRYDSKNIFTLVLSLEIDHLLWVCVRSNIWQEIE